MMKDIKDIIEPFGFSLGTLQSIATLLKYLKKTDTSIEDFIKFVEEEKAEFIKNTELYKKQHAQSVEAWKKVALKCSECGATMNLFPVNTHKGNQVEGDFKSMWMCSKCWHEEYTEKTVGDIRKLK